MEIKPCPRCNQKDYILKGNKCGFCGKSRTVCAHCNKVMGNSLHTENGEDVHIKCAEEYNICKQMGDMTDFVKKQDALVSQIENNSHPSVKRNKIGARDDAPLNQDVDVSGDEQ